jgi:hypothetical protein
MVAVTAGDMASSWRLITASTITGTAWAKPSAPLWRVCCRIAPQAGQEDALLLGPEHLSFSEVAAIISEVLDHEASYQQAALAGLEMLLTGAHER